MFLIYSIWSKVVIITCIVRLHNRKIGMQWKTYRYQGNMLIFPADTGGSKMVMLLSLIVQISGHVMAMPKFLSPGKPNPETTTFLMLVDYLGLCTYDRRLSTYCFHFLMMHYNQINGMSSEFKIILLPYSVTFLPMNFSLNCSECSFFSWTSHRTHRHQRC